MPLSFFAPEKGKYEVYADSDTQVRVSLPKNRGKWLSWEEVHLSYPEVKKSRPKTSPDPHGVIVQHKPRVPQHAVRKKPQIKPAATSSKAQHQVYRIPAQKKTTSEAEGFDWWGFTIKTALIAVIGKVVGDMLS